MDGFPSSLARCPLALPRVQPLFAVTHKCSSAPLDGRRFFFFHFFFELYLFILFSPSDRPSSLSLSLGSVHDSHAPAAAHFEGGGTRGRVVDCEWARGTGCGITVSGGACPAFLRTKVGMIRYYNMSII